MLAEQGQLLSSQRPGPRQPSAQQEPRLAEVPRSSRSSEATRCPKCPWHQTLKLPSSLSVLF